MPELFPLTHEPETAVRPSIYGEGCFVEQWKIVLNRVPDHGDGTTDEMFCTILGDLEPVDQRDATVAASFICWLGTNAGACYLLAASKRSAEGEPYRQSHQIEWALHNRRRSHVNNGRRTVEALLKEPTIRDLEVIEKLAEWLDSKYGAAFIRAAHAEIEATRKAIVERTQMENRARQRAALAPGAIG